MAAKSSLNLLRRASTALSQTRNISSALTKPPSADVTQLKTHTGQLYEPDDFRNVRFENNKRVVNTKFAIDLVKEQPIVVCDQSTVWSCGGGALGHPRIFINLNKPEVHDCTYSGRRFIKKKYYDPAVHGTNVITFEQYEKEVRGRELSDK
jgi:NADH dehydrogenase (ubiquinone) Fe-S protein 6